MDYRSNTDMFLAQDPSQLLGPGTAVLRNFADRPDLLAELLRIADQSQFRHMETPGGFRMSVAMTSCGSFGWVTDRSGYRYDCIDPLKSAKWPAMPPLFARLAYESAAAAGFAEFVPDSCLINRYAPATQLTLHQDKNERDFSQPIVSVSLGVPAMFMFGGDKRTDRAISLPVFHGDVVVWGGISRLRYHGIKALKEASHPLTGNLRYNLTFRKVM